MTSPWLPSRACPKTIHSSQNTKNMPSKARIPEALDRHLRTSSGDKSPSVTQYIEVGSSLVTSEAIAAVRAMLPALRTRVAAIKDSAQLKRRIEMLSLYFEEAANPSVVTSPCRDVAFALIYFIKGYDRVPDSLPEIGLLDDAIIAGTVLEWHNTSLRAHWRQRGRSWPDEI